MKNKKEKQLFLFRLCGNCGDVLPSDDKSGISICVPCLTELLQEILRNLECHPSIWKDRK